MRQALQDMILLEASTLEELRTAVDDIIDTAVALLYLSGEDRAAVVLVLRHIAASIQTDVTRIILSAREQASELAYHTVVIDAELIESNPEDEARASVVGLSYASAWLAAALAAVVLKQRDLKKVTKTQDYRLSRIATTEVAEAYGQAALASYDKISEPEQWMKRWDATLDMNTCQICRSHHGETVPLNESFSDGDEPGAVHPRCRCQPTLIKLSSSQAA